MRSIYAAHDGAASLLIQQVAGGTSQLPEKPLALLRHGAFRAAAAQPILVVRLAHHGDPSDHTGMLGSAIFGAEEVIASRLSGGEPHGVIAAGNHVVLHAERRDKETVNDVLRCQRQPYRLAHRDVQLVNFALALGILNLPHPLLADNVNVHCARRRAGALKEYLRAPPEKRQHDDERNHRPGNLQLQGAVNGRRNFVRGTTPVFDGKEKDRAENDHSHDDADRRQIEIQVVDAAGNAGSRLGKKW